MSTFMSLKPSAISRVAKGVNHWIRVAPNSLSPCQNGWTARPHIVLHHRLFGNFFGRPSSSYSLSSPPSSPVKPFIQQQIQPLSEKEILAFKNQLAPRLREKEWYTILMAAIASSHFGGESSPLLWTLATCRDASESDESYRNRTIEIQQRLQESLMKGSVLFGIPGALDSVFSLLSHLRTFSPQLLLNSTHFQRRDLLDQKLCEITKRAHQSFYQVYRHNMKDLMDLRMSNNMQDLKLLTFEINYGITLSEVSILNFASTELVILASLIPQNCRHEILWHLRGCQRAGWSNEEISSVRELVIRLATRLGCRTNRVPRLDEVKEDSND